MKKTMMILPILALSLAGLGCSKKMEAKEGTSSSDVVDIDDILDDDGSGSGSTTGNNTVGLNTTYSAMNDYVAMRPLNSISDVKVTIDLTKDSRNRYSGTVVISYRDNGVSYQGVFQSGSSLNPDLKYASGQNMYEHDYNYWFKNSGMNVFSGYFQDPWGGLVVVVDEITNQGNNDGVGKTVLSGSIWYRNFPIVQSTQGAMRKCWFITLGPYDCRSTPVTNKSSIYPADTYKKLGTFTGLPKSAAFKTLNY